MSDQLAIRMAEVDKYFGGVRANEGASLEVQQGEIHALVGENGAGKSTLMKVLSGMYEPNAGIVEVRGRVVTGWSTAEAIGAGVGMVHQHFMLVPTLTVAENVILGTELTSAGGLHVDRVRAEREVDELAKRTGFAIEARRTVADLSVGELQRVEILKTLYRGATILILDEPTAVLSPPEVRELWNVLRRLRGDGDTIVLITHKLDEVMEISDRITVMRHGKTVARMKTSETSPKEIARAMVGRDVALAEMPSLIDTHDAPDAGSAPPRGAAESSGRAAGGAALTVEDLTVSSARAPRAVDAVSFTIARGEILGIAGVEGNGQTELIEALSGLRAVTGGSIRMTRADGSTVDLTNLDVRSRGDAGLSHIPEDRHARGLILDYSVAENLILGQQHHYAGRAGTIDRDRVMASAAEQIRAYDVRPPDATLSARALSGGNQQKVIIAREMGRDFDVLLAAQPTRGVDVGAIEFIHRRLREARDAGKAILVVSADLAEVLSLSDRVAVMYGGRIVAIMRRGEATPDSIGPYMTGVSERVA
jgi:general nucleoside transport system ATP-binding protein